MAGRWRSWQSFLMLYCYTFPETNVAEKGWQRKTILSFWVLAYFQGQTVSFREGIIYFHWHEGHVPALPFNTIHCRLMYQVRLQLSFNIIQLHCCLEWCSLICLPVLAQSVKNWLDPTAGLDQTPTAISKIRSEGVAWSATVCMIGTLDVQIA